MPTNRKKIVPGKSMGFRLDPVEIRRLLKLVVVSASGCWQWQNGCDREGYPFVKLRGRKLWAHRVFYEIFGGRTATKKAEGNQVDHLCFNRKCVNPAHLKARSHSANAGRKRPLVGVEDGIAPF